MYVIFEQVFILMVFMVIGFGLSKAKIVNKDNSKILSELLVYVFLPCNIFKSFAANCSVDYIKANYNLILVSTVIIVILGVSAFFASKLFSKNAYEQRIYEYALVIPNIGYMGYALAESLGGETMLLNVMMFGMPVSVYIYAYGFCMLTKRGVSLKKLFNPAMVALFIGMVVGLLAIPVPGMLMSVLTKTSNCMAPVSMLLAGIVISGFNLKTLVVQKKNYIVTALRLLVIPLIIGSLVKFFCNGETALISVMLYAMPCGLNAIVYPRLVDENCEIGAGQAVVSNLLAILTIPFVLSFFGGNF